MIYSELPECDHPAVDLRPIAASDLEDWFAYLSLPIVYEHTSWEIGSSADLADYARAQSAATPDSMLRLAICSRSSGQLVGTVGFHSLWWRDRRAELAYDLHPSYWGKGIATHVASLMLRWAHRHVGINRVQATVLESNSRSHAVLRRCNFRREGSLREYRFVRGKPSAFAIYSHLASDGAA
ncbi:GNAT family N-acetyltransferase [Ramlibacter sp. MMS24-I3-19]|uniref:GNAT family N-acetyltransferase n=1 Tax=Ramlibacter sp. MMS24-I3-19 TaxID=3416606 RepID=UPI003CFEB804